MESPTCLLHLVCRNNGAAWVWLINFMHAVCRRCCETLHVHGQCFSGECEFNCRREVWHFVCLQLPLSFNISSPDAKNVPKSIIQNISEFPFCSQRFESRNIAHDRLVVSLFFGVEFCSPANQWFHQLNMGF